MRLHFRPADQRFFALPVVAGKTGVRIPADFPGVLFQSPLLHLPAAPPFSSFCLFRPSFFDPPVDLEDVKLSSLLFERG